MSLTTKDKKANSESRFAKVQELRKFHQSSFDALGVPDAEFVPKMAYVPKGMEELCIGFFESELSKSVNYFTEFVNKELSPEDPERKLYLFKYNPHWEEEYVQYNNGNYTFRMVPVSELYKVELPTAVESPKQPLQFNIEEAEDALINDMSIRDLAAILWRVPCSNKPFLNKLINQWPQAF